MSQKDTQDSNNSPSGRHTKELFFLIAGFMLFEVAGYILSKLHGEQWMAAIKIAAVASLCLLILAAGVFAIGTFLHKN